MLYQLTVTHPERESARLLPQNLDAAVTMLRDHGYVALHNVADPAHLDAICAQMYADIETWNATAAEPVAGGNFTPSRKPELLFRDVMMNAIVASVLAELMGAEVSCGMYSSNVTFPHLGDQELHVDMKPHQAGDDLSGPCHAAVVNFPLVDFTIENGATELWPGTHRLLREPGDTYVSARLQDERRAIVPPVRAELPRGSCLIRDIRLWHRGTLNNCNYVRPMLALICNGGHRPGVDPQSDIHSIGPVLPETRPFFQDAPAIHYNVDFTNAEIIPAPGHLPHLAP